MVPENGGEAWKAESEGGIKQDHIRCALNTYYPIEVTAPDWCPASPSALL